MSNEENQCFISHLEALREMLLKSIVSIVVFSPIGFWSAPKFINFLMQVSLPKNISQLHYFSPMDVFIIQIKIGILIALILAYPYIIYEISKFIKPALYKHEAKFLSILVFSATILFIFGGLFCIFSILPLIMNFAAGFSSELLAPTIGLANFINLVIGLIIAFGLMFEIPLAVILCAKLGIIRVSLLKKIRPYVLVGILILAGLLTPPDIVSQLLLTIPTYVLFEVGILVAEKFINNEDKICEE